MRGENVADETLTIMNAGSFSVRIFADGADLAAMVRLAQDKRIQGFTTNPTLMRKAGVSDYGDFARRVLAALPQYPISFEVFADEFAEMEAQAHCMAQWGENVFVKIPISNTRGESSVPLVEKLAKAGVKLNVTALTTEHQVAELAPALRLCPAALVSVFAGRIADTGRDPVPIMRAARELLRPYPRAQLLWASPREILNLVQAEQAACHVITMTSELIAKIPLLGRDLTEFSLETVRMFHDDAMAAGFSLTTAGTRAAVAGQ